MTTTLIDGAKKHCWNIVFRSGMFHVLSPDNNSEFKTENFTDAIDWCNIAADCIPAKFKALVNEKKKELLSEHLKEWEKHYKDVYGMHGVRGLHKEVYDFTSEYNEINYQLKLEHDRDDYAYLSDVLKTMIIEKLTK